MRCVNDLPVVQIPGYVNLIRTVTSQQGQQLCVVVV